MRILYGVSGEGFGHSSRAKVIIEHLIRRGHQVLVLTYGQAVDVLKAFPMIKVEGIRFIVENNRINIGKTIQDSLDRIVRNIRDWPKIQKRVDEFKPEICITDFEPLVPIIRYWKKLSLISIDNQHRITHLSLKVPKEDYGDFILARQAVNSCVARADAFIILSFFKSKPKGKNAYIVNPILRREVLELKPSVGEKILVYSNKPNQRLVNFLKEINEKFVVYGFNEDRKWENIKFRRAGIHFLKDVESAKAIIATSGFSLMSEALYLKKPYFAMPMGGQFEQTLNALFLKQAGFGDYSKNVARREIENFISKIEVYRKNLERYKSNPNEAFTVLDKVLNKIMPFGQP